MKRILPAILLICLIAGCGGDERLVQMAKEHEARQAEQNLKMAELQKSVAEGSKRLVEAEAESRDKFLAMQDNLRADQATVGQQRDKLEAERREIAQQRIRDPIIAAAIVAGRAFPGLPAAAGAGRLSGLRDEAHGQPRRRHRRRISRHRTRCRASVAFGTADATAACREPKSIEAKSRRS